MPFEKVTITEEVQKNGAVVEETRETLKWVDEPVETIGANLAVGLTHPGFVPASERVYTWDEDLGMSVSKPREEVVETEESTADSEEVTEEAETESLPEYKPSRRR